MSNNSKNKEMTTKWKDRLFGVGSGLLLAIIPTLILISANNRYNSDQLKYDETKSIQEKVQELELNKVSRPEFVEECKTIDQKLDKKVDYAVFNEHLKFQENMLKAQVEIQKDIKQILKEMPR